MPKTPAPRVRAVNLYTIEADGAPVAQAEAISQTEAVALWVASQQQPTLSARLSTPREARALAHLPLLSRGAAPERDLRVPDMFDDPELIATYCPPVEIAQVPIGVMPAPERAEELFSAGAHPLGLDAEAVEIMTRLSTVEPERRTLFTPLPKGAGKVPAMYRNPATGESWSGRGLKPKWALLAIDEGKVLEDFRITA